MILQSSWFPRFRGRPTTERLLHDGHNVTVVSRGQFYWKGREELLPRVNHWRCNRTLTVKKGAALEKSSGLAACNQFHDAGFFDAVVDFSSRNHQEVRQVAGLLSGRVGVYVFVSSHLVYRVSRAPDHDGPLLESDAVRPGREVSPLAREQARGIDARGDGDLDCETELMKQYNAGGFPFVVRFSDREPHRAEGEQDPVLAASSVDSSAPCADAAAAPGPELAADALQLDLHPGRGAGCGTRDYQGAQRDVLPRACRRRSLQPRMRVDAYPARLLQSAG
ncbi:unnamed protein product [Prorocentrum cordatum]|uniref:NAD(P)-binding domain-containing protein n=1 Tax=Prorocentrum cordatum TaxID=2364126 RepID=A0ABN9WK72_9DINO|nr:unnamed protein product [Polarella glacialis]